MHKSMKSILLTSSAAVFTAFGANSVHAQQTDQSEEGASVIDTVIVTALKRGDQSLLDAPAAINSIDGDAIEDLGADSLTDFIQLAPGVSISRGNGSGSTTIQVRGVNATFGSASVGFYMDDLPVSLINLNFLPDPSPFDLQSVEVLKGPQGALYGAGSSGGVVLVRTNDPVLDEFSGKLDLSAADTDDGGAAYSTSGALNIPIIEDVAALRGSISYQNNGGWIDDTFDPSAEDINDEERLNARVKLLIEPNDQLSVKLLGVWSRNNDDYGLNAADDNNEFPLSAVGFTPISEVDFDQYGAIVTYEFPYFTATNAFGYIDYSSNQTQPFLAPIPTFTDLETYANEFRLNSTHGGPFSWVAGVFYRNSEQALFQDVSAIGVPTNLDDSTESEQWSVFGEGTLELLDGDLAISLGGSYFWDDTSNNTVLGPLSPTPEPVVNEVDTRLFNPQASIAYHPTSNTTIYARYAEGFRAGTVDFGLPLFFAQSVVPTLTGMIDPEEIRAYELGAKGEFADGMFYVEGAFFYNDIEDIQQSAAVLVPGTTVPANTVINAGDAQSIGFEWLITAKPIEGANITFSGAYTEAEISEDFFAPGADPLTATPLFAGGDRLNLVPQLILNGSASHTWALGFADLEATASVNVQYSSDRALTVLASDPVLGDDVVRTDLRFEVGRDVWSVYVFAENVNNEDGAIAPNRRAPTLISASAPLDGIFAERFRPRTIGGGLRVSF